MQQQPIAAGHRRVAAPRPSPHATPRNPRSAARHGCPGMPNDASDAIPPISVSMHDVFPHGCCLVPDSITEAQDYDEKTKRRTPSVDKVTGKRVWQCRVSDLDPDL